MPAINLIRSRYFIKLSATYQGETRRGAVAASSTIPAGTYNYQKATTRYTVSTQYSLSKRLALYGSVSDFFGGFRYALLRFAPDTPGYAKPQRVSELGFYTTIGVQGSF